MKISHLCPLLPWKKKNPQTPLWVLAESCKSLVPTALLSWNSCFLYLAAYPKHWDSLVWSISSIILLKKEWIPAWTYCWTEKHRKKNKEEQHHILLNWPDPSKSQWNSFIWKQRPHLFPKDVWSRFLGAVHLRLFLLTCSSKLPPPWLHFDGKASPNPQGSGSRKGI